MDEANFENILTAELYTVNLNGSKKFKSADMYAGEFSPDGNYLMISTIQNHFPILFLSIVSRQNSHL
jgi:hypothetical protein